MKQGADVVLLTRGDLYFEVLSRNSDVVEIMGPTGGQAVGSIKDLSAAGFVATRAIRIIKSDETWVYCAGLDIYSRGKRWAPVKGNR